MITEIQVPKFTSRAVGTAAEMPLRAPFTNRSLKEKANARRIHNLKGLQKDHRGLNKRQGSHPHVVPAKLDVLEGSLVKRK